MASTLPFHIVDIFSTTPYKGNPLAVVDARAASPPLTDTQLKLIARQFNLSETTFFFPPSSADSKARYKLRSFLPDGREVYGAGHNILGVWWYIANAGLLDFSTPPGATNGYQRTFYQELGGQISPVRVMRDGQTGEISVAIRQASPKAHGVHPDQTALAQSFGIRSEDIGFGKIQLPPQVMSTSTTHHLLVPVSSIDALNRVLVQRDTLLEQLKMADERVYGVYFFTPLPTESSSSANRAPTYQARFFSPGMSGEDPATGSAAGPLATYLFRHGVVGSIGGKGDGADREGGEDSSGTVKIVVHQGLRVGRECVIEVVGNFENTGELEVDIVGGGSNVAQGSILIPGTTTEF